MVFTRKLDVKGKVTFGKICEQLTEFLSRFSESLEVEDEEDKGSRVHPYGPINMHSELADIHQVINAMKSRCDQLKIPGSGAVNVLKSAMESQNQEDMFNPLKTCLRTCIERLRNATQDITLKTVIQKLQAISEECCLRFDNGGQTGTDCFISSHMFYFEIKLDTSGGVIDVREQLHSGEPKSCQELVDILRDRDYNEFKSRLKQLADLYKIKVDTFMKSSKIFAALEAVEKDIFKISTMDGNPLNSLKRMQEGAVGYVFRREGGQLMQLSYFVSPIEALNEEKNKINFQSGMSRSFGTSLQIAVESSKVRRLPISSLAVVDDARRIRYEALDNNNSDELPASFVMKLSKQLPMSASNLSEIHNIVTRTAADKFDHSSEASLDNLILKQHLQLKTREEWSQDPFQVMLPNKEEHIYRITPVEKTNVGFVISRITFSHPSQVAQIIKVLRRQLVYNVLLSSCSGEKATIQSHSKSEYFLVKATNASTIDVTFQNPVHTSIASVSFTVSNDNSVKTSINFASKAPIFCTSSYIDQVVNRCLSIPITMRSILRKASAYVPCISTSKVTDTKTKENQSNSKDESSRPKHLKLLIPSLSIDNSGSVPLVSPGILSASALPTFTINSNSPSSQSFQFPVADMSATLPGGYTKPAFSSPKKHKGSPNKASTPGTPKSRTFKLPKITLKRKRDGDEYEIDKEKSNFDLLEESEAQTIAESLVDDAVVNHSNQDSNAEHTANKSQDGKSRDLTIPTASTSFDLSMDPMQSNSININSVGEIEGLLLGPGIDVSNLMGGNISANFDITGPSFTEGFGSRDENQVEAFDLDAITSAGSHMNFGVDDSLNGASGGVIDPSMVVSSSSALTNTPVFDVNASFIDIDSFIMGPTSEHGGNVQATDGASMVRNDQKL